jgi:sec-independent protein translocase protein TatC
VKGINPAKASFFEHLDELRTRFIRCGLILVIATVVAFGFKEQLFHFFMIPIRPLMADEPGLLSALSPIEMFIVYLKLSFVAGFIVSYPLVLWQVWRFLVPALKVRERRAVVPFLFFGSLAFVGGAAFCFIFVLPVGLEVLHGMLPPEVEAHYSTASYFGLVTLMVIAFGLVFDLPVLMVLLARVGILHPKTVAQYRSHIIVGLFVVGAMLTPPDPYTQVMLALPMWVLFEVGLVVSRLVIAAAPPPPNDD